METTARIAADILVAAVSATENRIISLDAKQATELAEAFKIIYKAVDSCRQGEEK